MAREPICITELESRKKVRLIDLKEDELELMSLQKYHFYTFPYETDCLREGSQINPELVSLATSAPRC